MDKIALGVSVLNGEIRAAAVRKGAIAQASWQSAATSEDLVGVGAALKEAIQNTRPGGKKVAIVLAHPKLSDQLIDVPPVKGWKLDQVIFRKAESSKTFTGDAVWSHQPALPTKTAKSELLHLCPKAVIDQLSKGCGEAELQLVRVLPTTSVLISQLKALPLKKDELAILAAETGNATTLVIGRKDGLVCLGRVVRSSWNTEPERVNVDLTRSIGFAEQQTGLTVASVWLFGDGALAQVPVMQAMLKLPVSVSPVPYSPFYWAEQAAKLSSEADGNLLSREAQQAPQRQRFLTATGALLAFLLLATLLAATVIEVLRHRTEKAIAVATAKIGNLRIQKTEIEHSLVDLTQMRAVTRIIKDERLPEAPAWFLGYLGEVVPDELVLTELHVKRTNNLWQVRLALATSSGTNQPAALDQALTVLSNSLATGPFHLAINPPPPVKKVDDTWSDEPVAIPEAARINKDLAQFLIEGWMR